jgi:ABC-type oligopeptide transport system substrate-binding subunit
VLVLADDALDPAVSAVDKAWKGAFGFDFDRWILRRDSYKENVDKASYHALVAFLRPAYDDPMAYLEVFADSHPSSATGWKNATYDALVAGASDPAAFAKAPPEAVLKGLADPAPVQAALAKAKAGDTAALRQALLQAAEGLLIDEAVVVPLWLAPEAGLLRAGLHGVDRKSRSVLDVGPLPAISFDPAK